MLRAAALGHTYAMNELGYIFLYGKGEAGRRRARHPLLRGRRRARRHLLAQQPRASSICAGRAGAPTPAKALGYFTRAAAGGHPFAPTNLGRMARDGVGGPKDLHAAARWLELAAERGDYWGALDRARMESDSAVAAKFLALAVSLNREGDNYDSATQAQKLLDKLPEAAVKKALDSDRRSGGAGGQPSRRN